LQRQTWQHGCDNSHACGAKYHKTQPCKRDCRRHTRKPCPPSCRPKWVSHARWCPKRHSGGLVEVEVKSRAGRRSFAVPDELYALLLKHEELQQREREHAGSEWQKGSWIFTQPNGRPIDPAVTTTSGGRCSPRPVFVKRGYMTHGTQRPLCSCFWVSRTGPLWTSWVGPRSR
jgi:hypothetical protein